jgi:hypothetical protein
MQANNAQIKILSKPAKLPASSEHIRAITSPKASDYANFCR